MLRTEILILMLVALLAMALLVADSCSRRYPESDGCPVESEPGVITGTLLLPDNVVFYTDTITVAQKEERK